VTAASQPSLLSRLLLLLIRLYQLTLSRLLPVVSLGTCACRFSPTCSCYAAEALRLHGAPRGLLLAVRRLLRCTPLHPGGFDPVPPPRLRPAPVCRAATSA
jgi:putative membrane protein insertion efficiency factor